MASLSGKAAIVTGGARGIGIAVAEALGRAGACVTVCDIRPEVEEAVADLRGRGLAVRAVLADVSLPGDVRRLVEGAGAVDVVVNNAAVMQATRPTDPWDQAAADFEALVGANLRGPYLVGRAVIPGMIERGGGDIVNVATDHIHTCGWPTPVDHRDSPDCPWRDRARPPGGGPSFDLYDATKWGLNGLTQSWAKALRPHAVRVNNICPGATDTEMLRSFLGTPPAADVVATWFRPSQVADVVVELLAEGPTGRSGDNIGLWVGHPPVLPPPGRTAIP